MVQGTAFSCEVIIMTALSVEYQAVLHFIEQPQEIVHPTGTIYQMGSGAGKDGTLHVAVAQIGIGGTRAALETEKAVGFFHPRIILFVGIAGGRKDVRHSDAVVATKIYSYESGKVGARFEPRPEIWQPGYALEQRARHEASSEAWLARLEERPQQIPQVFLAPLAAGEVVFASTQGELASLLASTYGDSLAVEMEGHGFLQAIYVNPTVHGLVIRGIANLIDDKTPEGEINEQRVAAMHASAFAFQVLTTFTLPTSAHYPERETIWHVPYYRNPYFMGRETVLQSLRLALAPGAKASALTQSISGLAGIGKTQVALEYALRYGEYYKAVLWITADSLEIATANLLRLATEVLGLPEQQEAAQQIAVVKMWLQRQQNWLLILDNVKDPQQILSTFIPTKHQGSVLITTRQRNVGPHVHQSEVLQVFPEKDAVLFLLRRSGSLDEEALATEAKAEDVVLARSLCQLLDRLPLALDQAGAYIVETGCSLQGYIDLYTTHRRELLDRRDAEDQPQCRSQKSDHPTPVLMTFQLAWEQIQQRNLLAGEALQCCAFLAPHLIPEALIQAGITLSQGKEAVNDLLMSDALGLLHRYSLVERGENNTLTVHRLVQEVLQDIVSEEKREHWMERTVQAVERRCDFPSPQTTSRRYEDLKRTTLYPSGSSRPGLHPATLENDASSDQSLL